MDTRNITLLLSLVTRFNRALDTGKYDDISAVEVKEIIKDGTIFGYLDKKLGDSGFYPTPDAQVLIDDWKYYAESLSDLEIENRGLCLLIAYVLENIQQEILPPTAVVSSE